MHPLAIIAIVDRCFVSFSSRNIFSNNFFFTTVDYPQLTICFSQSFRLEAIRFDIIPEGSFVELYGKGRAREVRYRPHCVPPQTQHTGNRPKCLYTSSLSPLSFSHAGHPIVHASFSPAPIGVGRKNHRPLLRQADTFAHFANYKTVPVLLINVKAKVV